MRTLIAIGSICLFALGSQSHSQSNTNITSTQQAQGFKNVVRNEDACGFSNGGKKHFLINNDTATRFRVTVRATCTVNTTTTEYDTVFESQAGGRHFIACSWSGAIPVKRCSRKVVGEVPY